MRQHGRVRVMRERTGKQGKATRRISGITLTFPLGLAERAPPSPLEGEGKEAGRRCHRLAFAVTLSGRSSPNTR